jgi:hypothetical protein
MANAVALASASARVVLGLVSGARKPIRIEPEPRPRIVSGSGGSGGSGDAASSAGADA